MMDEMVWNTALRSSVQPTEKKKKKKPSKICMDVILFVHVCRWIEVSTSVCGSASVCV